MHPIVLLQVLAHILLICGFILIFAFRHHLLLNAHTPTTGKTLGYIGALILLLGLLAELVIDAYSVSNLAGWYSYSGLQ